jgi:NAD(P)-dependent dehydrogenase (short-subunit alcohol dehydrogenase family)
VLQSSPVRAAISGGKSRNHLRPAAPLSPSMSDQIARKPRGLCARSISPAAKALAFVADVAEPQMVQRMVVATAEYFGRIDILVNNAAVRAEQALSEMTLEQWRAVTAVILDGAFNCVKACLPYLQKSGAGAIVNIGGLSAHTGAKRRPQVVTAKAGLIGFTRALAHELADDKIRVNIVSPGLMGIPRPAGANHMSRWWIRWSAVAAFLTTSRQWSSSCAARVRATSRGKIFW